MEELFGGRKGSIYRNNNVVIRPLHSWSTTIHCLLKYLRDQGFTGCPEFIKIDGETEVLSFIEGDTYNYPLTGAVASEDALISAAQLLRKLHDCSSRFMKKSPTSKRNWMLPSKEPQEVICHGDFAPYNVALKESKLVGVFDFDTAHQGPRVWDLAYSVYCWAPFKTNAVEALGSLAEQTHRANIFCNVYGATVNQRKALVETMIQRLHALLNFMKHEAELENETFQLNITQGHHLSYLDDIESLHKNKQTITSGLLADN